MQPTVSANIPQRLRVVDSKAFAPATAYRVPDDVEEFVIERALASHQPNAPADVLAEIRTQAAARRSGAGPATTSTSPSPGPAPACPCGPVYEPQWWNDGATKQAFNNCYN